METLFESFHFARPMWLLALLPIGFIVYLFLGQIRSTQLWSKHIAPELLQQLTDTQSTATKSYLFSALVAALSVLLVLALAGPSFESKNVQTLKTDDTLVVIMDMSLSMLAEDVKPSRLQRMKFKLQDLLEKRQTGFTALIAYSGDAHVVVPLTEDTQTIQHLAKSLSPWMIPSKGSRLSRAVEEANKLLDAYPSSNARILLFTDEISDQQLDKTLAISRYPTFVVGIGTQSGAPIPLTAGKLLKDNKQNIVIARFNADQPKTLARKTGGQFNVLSVDDGDIEAALAFEPKHSETPEAMQQLAAVKDYGYLLLIPALFLMLMSFRKGWLLALSLVLIQPTDSYANTQATNEAMDQELLYEPSLWDYLSLNQNQQAEKAYQLKDFGTAAKQFTNPLRQGDAYAKARLWHDAETAYQGQPSAVAKYNLANVQAQQWKLEEAIASYQHAIDAAQTEQHKEVLERATKDKAYLEQLLEQMRNQQENQEQQQGQEGSDSQQDQSGDPSSGEQSSGDQSSSDQSPNEQASDDQTQGSQNEQQGADQDDASESDQQQAGSQGDDSQSQSSASQNPSEADQQQASSNENKGELSDEQAQSAAQASEDSLSEETEQDANQAMSSQAAPQPGDQGISDYSEGTSITSGGEPTEEDIEEQKYQQILRKVQTDPSILLENKFRIQHFQRNKPENEAQVW